MVTKEEKKFTEFRKLYQCVAKLIRCQSYLSNDGIKDVEGLESLARKMEVSSYIQKRDIIAVAGMQGTGKSTLIKNIYELPKDILKIGSGRSERIPIFITEKEHLKSGEYEAREVYFVSGEKQGQQIDISEVSRKSSRSNAAYIEVFVPYRFFNRDNAGFVLLPGFEKNQDCSFDKDYNSLMEYTLHFANAVILVTDNSGIANDEMNTLTKMLGKNFISKNCVFAITKCDGLDDDDCEELRNSLRTACMDNQLEIGINQIVCVGDYGNAEDNLQWIEQLLDTVGDNIDYTADKKEYTYFKPMTNEMLGCARELASQLDTLEFDTKSSSPIYVPLKDALDKAESELEKKLETLCEQTKKDVAIEFAEAFDAVDNRHKRKKVFFFFEKTFSQKERDRDAIEKACIGCLKAPNSKESRFIVNVRNSLAAGDERARLCAAHDAKYAQCVTGDMAMVTPEQQRALINGSARFYLDAGVKNLPEAVGGAVPENKAIAQLIALEFEGFFIGALGGKVRMDDMALRSGSVTPVLKAVTAKWTGMDAAKVITMADLLDGKPDILNGVVSLFIKDAEVAAKVVSTGCCAAAIAVAVVAVAKKGISFYNEDVRAQNAVGEAWKNALMNAVEEQKNSCLDSFHLAGEKLLEHVDQVHRTREHIADTQRRIAEAKYAVSDIRDLVDTINDKYARTLESK